MKTDKEIQAFSAVPQNKTLIKPLLSPAEEKLVALVANLIVDKTIERANEKGNTLPPLQS